MKHVIGLLATLAGLAAATGCDGRAATPAETTGRPAAAPGVVEVPPDSPMLAQLKRDTVKLVDLPTDEVVAPGKIEANPNRVSKVVLPVSGRITSVLVKTGDAVEEDQPLLTIASPDADSAMSAYLSAQATVTQAEAALGKAQADLDRASDLFEHNAVAKKDVLNAESALTQAKAAVQQAHASREQTVRRLSVLGLTASESRQQVVVRSPLAGKVLELTVVPGEYRNDTSASVMTIADLATVWVTSQVPESYIRFVQAHRRRRRSADAHREGAGGNGQPRRTLPARDVRQHPSHRGRGEDSGRSRRSGGREQRRAQHRVRRDVVRALRTASGVGRQARGRRRESRERRDAGRYGRRRRRDAPQRHAEAERPRPARTLRGPQRGSRVGVP
ncbi:MAG: hypothetical protein DMG03_16770 [Acidobacteria bacterium]|nr:MAG: hypothetical protein DMG03_16770 [Acidobacteriota bacterium]